MLGYNFLGNTKAVDAPKTAADQKVASDEPAKKAFTGGDQGFIDLKLKEVEKYNHNTKKLIFELPEDSVKRSKMSHVSCYTISCLNTN